ncbi:C40 family peptidase [Clostridium sp. CS001]|uniref:C40 family peptidase n=1 Tax=Clostridium sp. CS001 TaxID=2880648 RepID=UPI001CF3C653|nr:C40 family peptidase [Clostridium sp. CS001]MCB2288715.1 C40 family peptidase [Clostridium sp. CS001]
MSILKFNLVKFVVFVLAIGVCTSIKTQVVKADVAIKGQTQVVLRSATFKTDNVIKVPDRSAEKKQKEAEKRLSRGETSSSSSNSEGRNDIISYAYDFIGKPYVWGAEGPKSFDCSGFTKYVYRAFGVSLPHYTGSQIGEGSSVSRKNLKQGDLVFFNTDGSSVSHVGIYVGDGEFIHASSGSHKVTVSNLGQSYYNAAYVGARRILE